MGKQQAIARRTNYNLGAMQLTDSISLLIRVLVEINMYLFPVL